MPKTAGLDIVIPMLDLRFIKEHSDEVKKNVENRFMDADVDAVLRLYDERNELISTIDGLRQRRNENAKKMKGKMPPEERDALISEGKALKTEIAALEDTLKEKEALLSAEAAKIPNMAHPDAPETSRRRAGETEGEEPT